MAEGSNLSTRDRIMAESSRLFAYHGYYGTSISQIANEVGIVKSTILHHFSSKQKLYTEIMKLLFAELRLLTRQAAGPQADEFAVLVQIFKSYLTWFRENPIYARLLIRTQMDNARQSHYAARRFWEPIAVNLENIIKRGQENGQLRPIDARMFMIQITNSIVNFAITYDLHMHLASPENQLTKDEVFQRFDELMEELIRRSLLKDV